MKYFKKNTLNILILLLVLAFIIQIIHFSHYDMTSDTVFATLISDGFIKDGFDFMRSYVSQQAIMPLHILYYGISLIVRLFTSDLLIVNKLSYIGNTFLLCLIIAYSYKFIFRDTTFKPVIILILSGMGSTTFRIFELYDPFWTIITIISFISFVLTTDLIEKFKIIKAFILSCIIIIFCAIDIRIGSSFCLPFLAAYTLYFIKKNFYLSKESLLGKIPKYLLIVLLIGMSSVLALIVRKNLVDIFDINERWAGGASFVFSNFENIPNNIESLLICLVANFGMANINGLSILSLHGLMWLFSAFVMTVMMFVCPILLFKKYSELSETIKIFLLYYWCNFGISFLLLSLSTNMDAYREIDTWNGAHYFIICQIQAIGLSIYYFNQYHWKKKSYLFNVILVLLFSSYCFQSLYLGIVNSYQQKEGVNNRQEIFRLIEENSVHYGYATFWNGPVNTILSRGNILIRGVVIQDNSSITPFYDQASRDWYKVGKNAENTFLLLTTEENAKINWETTQLQYYDVKSYKNYIVYFFNYDIAKDFVSTPFVLGEKREMLSKFSNVVGAIENTDGSKELSYGSAIDTCIYYPEKGEYCVKLNIECETDISFSEEIYKGENLTCINHPLQNGYNEIQITINRPINTWRLYIWNNVSNGKKVIVKTIEIEKIN